MASDGDDSDSDDSLQGSQENEKESLKLNIIQNEPTIEETKVAQNEVSIKFVTKQQTDPINEESKSENITESTSGAESTPPTILNVKSDNQFLILLIDKRTKSDKLKSKSFKAQSE